MPRCAPLGKRSAGERLGAEVLVYGRSFEARRRAEDLVRQGGRHHVHGFDAPHVIAGQGTLGLEVLEEVPHLGAIMCRSGAGAIAGIVAAV